MLKQLQVVGLVVITAISTLQLVHAADLGKGTGFNNGTTSSIQWSNKFDQAHKSNTKRQPLLVFLSVDGCYHCKRMEKTTFTDPKVVQAVAGNYVPVSIDGDNYPALVKHLGITSYPTTLIVDADLKVVSAMKGYQDANTLHQQLTKVKSTTVASQPDSDLR